MIWQEMFGNSVAQRKEIIMEVIVHNLMIIHIILKMGENRYQRQAHQEFCVVVAIAVS